MVKLFNENASCCRSGFKRRGDKTRQGATGQAVSTCQKHYLPVMRMHGTHSLPCGVLGELLSSVWWLDNLDCRSDASLCVYEFACLHCAHAPLERSAKGVGGASHFRVLDPPPALLSLLSVQWALGSRRRCTAHANFDGCLAPGLGSQRLEWPFLDAVMTAELC
jgi:hypothetical protein